MHPLSHLVLYRDNAAKPVNPVSLPRDRNTLCKNDFRSEIIQWGCNLSKLKMYVNYINLSHDSFEWVYFKTWICRILFGKV